MIREKDLACRKYLTDAVEYVQTTSALFGYVFREGHGPHGCSLVLVSDEDSGQESTSEG